LARASRIFFAVGFSVFSLIAGGPLT
jgi:hypothetical protein